MVNKVTSGISFSIVHENNEKRAIFEGYDIDDKDSKTGKIGVRCHNKFTGFFRWIFGNAVRKNTPQGTIFLNKNSLHKWKVRHLRTDGIQLKKSKFPTIKEFVENKLKLNTSSQLKSPAGQTLREIQKKRKGEVKPKSSIEEVQRKIVQGYLENRTDAEMRKITQSGDGKEYYRKILEGVEKQKEKDNYHSILSGRHPCHNTKDRIFECLALLNSQLAIP